MVCSVCCATYRSGFERCPRDGAVLAASDRDPVIGLVIAGRYRIEKRISDGAMGRVYVAHHVRLSKRFAIKILFGELAAQQPMRQRFELEAEAASRLEHRNLCSVVDFGESEQGLLYIVMEFIEGRTLERILREEGTFSEERTIRMAHDLCRGLRHLHSRSLIHRDLKLENVVVVPDRDVEVPKIVDFGIALHHSEKDARLTRAGAIVGTPAFMAPEQAFGDKIDARADLFSLGIVMVHLLCGRGPFQGSALDIIQQTVTKPIPPLKEINPDVHVSAGLEQIVMRLLSRQAEDRHPNAQAVIEALDQLPGSRHWGAGSNLTPLPEFDVAGDPVPPGTRRKRLPWIAGAAAASIVAAAITIKSMEPEVELEPLPQPPPPVVTMHAEDPAPPPPPPVETKKKKVSRKKASHRSRTKAAPKQHDTFMPLSNEVETKTRTTPEPAALASAYQKVGQMIERLADKRGNTVAARYRLRHVAIPLPASLKTDGERSQVFKQLTELKAEVAAELAR
jgi:serine/threonine-protein kinase